MPLLSSRFVVEIRLFGRALNQRVVEETERDREKDKIEKEVDVGEWNVRKFFRPTLKICEGLFQIESLPREKYPPRSVDTSRRKRRSKKKYRLAMKSYNINVSRLIFDSKIFFVVNKSIQSGRKYYYRKHLFSSS